MLFLRAYLQSGLRVLANFGVRLLLGRPEPDSRAEKAQLRLSSCQIHAICGVRPFPRGKVEKLEGFSQLRLTKAECPSCCRFHRRP